MPCSVLDDAVNKSYIYPDNLPFINPVWSLFITFGSTVPNDFGCNFVARVKEGDRAPVFNLKSLCVGYVRGGE